MLQRASRLNVRRYVLSKSVQVGKARGGGSGGGKTDAKRKKNTVCQELTYTGRGTWRE